MYVCVCVCAREEMTFSCVLMYAGCSVTHGGREKASSVGSELHGSAAETHVKYNIEKILHNIPDLVIPMTPTA